MGSQTTHHALNSSETPSAGIAGLGSNLAVWALSAIGVAGLAAGTALGQPLLAGAAGAGALIAQGLWASHSRRAARRALDAHAERLTQDAQAQQEEVAEQRMGSMLNPLAQEWVPTLSRHLTTASRQMETGITELTRAFSDIHVRLNETMGVATSATQTLGGSMHQSGGKQGLSGQVQGALNELLTSFRKSLDEKAGMFQEVKTFVSSTEELARMASSVEELAARTNLLALNAAIEAARAGEEGRGFSIVADEVRKLSMLSAETGQRIRERVVEISRAARKAGEGAERMETSDVELLGFAGQTVQSVVDHFQQVTEPLEQATQVIVHNTQEVSGALNHAVVHFQFQDRVSQILAHIELSLQQFAEQARNDPSHLDVGRLMHELQSRYTMAEERDNHGDAQPGTVAAAGEPDITFF